MDEYFNLVVVVDRNYTGTTSTMEKVAVSVYINGEFRQTNIMEMTITNDQFQALGNGNIALGGDYWSSDGGQRYLEMDNFLLYDGKLNDYQIADVASTVNNK